MQLKKAFIGGYKRKQVDNIVSQMKENEDLNNVKTAILENEFGLFKENSQKQIESIQRDIAIRQKSIVDLNASLDEKNSKINELNIIINLKIKEIEELQIARKQDEKRLEEIFNSKIADLEKSYEAKISLTESSLNEQLIEMQNKFQKESQYNDQYEDQIRKIGKIYFDAQENTDKLKQETKKTVLDSINQIFGDLYRTQNQFEAAFVPIKQKKLLLRQLTTEMEDTIRLLKTKMDSMDQELDNFISPFKHLDNTKDKIYNHVNKVYTADEDNVCSINTDCDVKTNSTNKNETESHIDNQTISPINKDFVNYSAQIETLRQDIDKQQELLSRMESVSKRIVSTEPGFDYLTRTALTTNVNLETKPISNTKTDVESKVDDAQLLITQDMDSQSNHDSIQPDISSDKSTGVSQIEKTDIDKTEQTLNRYERERNERENYGKVFARIGVNYDREAQFSESTEIVKTMVENQSAPSQQTVQNIGKPGDFDNVKNIENDLSNGIVDNTVIETEKTVQKKLSIKDILNKYANIK